MNWRDSVSLAFLVRCVGAAGSLGYGLLLAGMLSPTAMGEFTVAVSVAIIAATVSRFGLDAYLMRCAACEPGELRFIASRCLAASCLAGILAWGICVWAGRGADFAAGPFFAILLLGIPFLAMSYVLAGLLKAGGLPAAAVFLETGGWQCLMCVCAILMYLAGSDSPFLVAVCFALGNALMFAVFLHVSWRASFGFGLPARSVDSASRPGLREVAPLAGLSVGNVIMRWSDTLWIAWWLAPGEVAVYVVCTRLAGGIAFIDHAINAIAAPRFARQHQSGETQTLRREFLRACAMSGMFGALGAAAVALLGPYVLDWLGDPYSGAGLILRLAAVAMAVQVALVPIGHLAAMSGRASDHFKATILALALQQTAFLLLIPSFGMVAALSGFALSRIFAHLLTLAILRGRSEFTWLTG